MRRIPFYRHDLGDPEVDAFRTALAGPILTTGDVVAEFERRFAAAMGAPHAVGVTSCTGALHLALVALGIGPGDDVVTTPLTFIATATAILQAGARPVFADVEPATGNLDVTRLDAALTPRTRAVVPVHLFGQMCDMRALRALADRRGLAIVEDAAHCIEGSRDGIRPGMVSEAACFSFYATKSLTSGEGGALVVRDAATADQLRLLRLHGMTSSANERERRGYTPWDMVVMGWKYNMDNLQAAILMPQLARLGPNWARRRALAEAYRDRLDGRPGIRLPAVLPDAEHAWHLFTVQVERDRDAVVERLARAGVGVTVNYPPVHLTRWFRDAYGYRPGAFPVAEAIGGSTISLPLYATMPEADVEEVATRLVAALG